MENILTYKQITDVIKNIANNHFNIETVFFTKQFNVEDGEKKFPMLIIYPNSVYYPINNQNIFKTKEFNITIKIYDLIDKENDNEIDLFSDTAQILGDLITILSEHPDLQKKQAQIINSPGITPIFNELDSNANGWETIISIRTLNPTPYCQLPTNNLNL